MWAIILLCTSVCGSIGTGPQIVAIFNDEQMCDRHIIDVAKRFIPENGMMVTFNCRKIGGA